jgi:uncharacterized protein (TIGR02145 family)
MKTPFLAFLLFFLCATSLKAQLKEFEISEMPRPDVSIVQANTAFPEDALIIVYSSLNDLNFRSSMGAIDKQYYNMRFNRYEILVKPLKQMIFVIAPDIMEQNLLTINPKHNEEFYIKVEVNSDLGTVKDGSGNSYKTLKIDDQVWMAENLKSERYANGDLIPNVQNNQEWLNSSSWDKLQSGAWCSYNNLVENDKIYGKLYNINAVSDSRNICPIGWHVPSDNDWTILTDYLGGNVVGAKLKITGTQFWESPNTGATNESGFSGLPGGNRKEDGTYSHIGSNGYFWSSSYDDTDALGRVISYNDGDIYRIAPDNFHYGFSIRCIKD